VAKNRFLLTIGLLLASPLLIGGTAFRADFNQRLLATHNAERAAIGVPPLAWNASLAADARVWADELAATGRFEHSPDDAQRSRRARTCGPARRAPIRPRRW